MLQSTGVSALQSGRPRAFLVDGAGAVLPAADRGCTGLHALQGAPLLLDTVLTQNLQPLFLQHASVHGVSHQLCKFLILVGSTRLGKLQEHTLRRATCHQGGSESLKGRV